jgi:hypothetical protein
MLGMIQFENPGTRNRVLHRWVGWLYVLVQLAVWVPTWGIILSASKISVVRVCINAFGNLYWMYSLWRGIRHAQCKEVGYSEKSHFSYICYMNVQDFQNVHANSMQRTGAG